MANPDVTMVLEDVKKRKIIDGEDYSECNITIETGEDSPSTPASLTGSGSSSDDTRSALAGIIHMLKESKTSQEKTNVETTRWQVTAEKDTFKMIKDLGTCTASLNSVTAGLTSLTGTVNSIEARVLVLEEGGGGGTKGRGAGKGKPHVHSIASPRPGVDQWADGGDPWSNNRAAGLGFVRESASGSGAEDTEDGAWAVYNANQGGWKPYSTLTAKAPSANPHARPLAYRTGDRRTIIIGGFPSDTGRDDIESALREIVGPKAEEDGVTKIMAMGRYATCGRIEFKGNFAMWIFIKQHKGTRFPFDGKTNALWFSVEKTDYERLRAAKLSAILQRLVDFYMEKHCKTKPEVKKIIDADYGRGYIMFIRQEERKTGADGVETVIVEKFKQRIFNSNNGDKYFVAEGAREIEEFKNFDWDEAVNNSNTMISKAEAYNKEKES
jgi:hypothetical protein